jgi:GTP-binding protein HflX
MPTVSLVGYTNAGKSTLFNRLTGAHVYSADQLFATLDPTLRRLELPENQSVVLADTVGFIRHLPHDLVAAFRATLQETLEADLLLHVIDAQDERLEDNRRQVNDVLEEIGAREVPQIEIYNKVDLLERGPGIDYDPEGKIRRVWLSAHTGEGVDEFLMALSKHFRAEQVHGWLSLRPSEGRVRARLFELGAVQQETVDNNGAWHLEIQLPRKDFERVRKQAGLGSDCLQEAQ